MDGSESWIHLKDMKESLPVEVAEFVTTRGIADEPAFEWWVPYTLRKKRCYPSIGEIKYQKDDVQVWYRVAN